MKNFFVVLCAVLLCACMFCMDNQKNTITQAKEMAGYNAKSVALMSENGELLMDKNGNERLPVASMVKTMTLLLTMEALDNGTLKLSDKITATKEAARMGGSQVFIEEGTEYSVSDLIKSVVVASGNDAAVLLAQTIAGSEANFVSQMNKKARLLGLTNTNFVNCTGLPAVNNYSSANDMAVIMKNLISHKEFFNYSQIWMDRIEHSKGRFTEISNTNKLIKQYSSCDGGKTGSTSEAGFCVVATAKQGDLRLIAVVVGAQNSKDRFNDAKKLFNFGFANYESKNIISEGQEFTISVEGSRTKQICLKAKQSYTVACKRAEEPKYSFVLENDCVKAPVLSGETASKVAIVKDGVVVEKIDLISTENAPKITYKQSLKEISKQFA